MRSLVERVVVGPAGADIRLRLDGLGGLPVRMVSQSASRQNLTIVVAGADLTTAMTRLHGRFFSSRAAGDAPAPAGAIAGCGV